jgi:hypothetical protein
MKTPTLVHGEADNNPGTFTLQTERYFQAKRFRCSCTNGNCQKEAHGYVTKENILHLLWNKISSRKIFEELKLSYEGN